MYIIENIIAANFKKRKKKFKSYFKNRSENRYSSNLAEQNTYQIRLNVCNQIPIRTEI